MTNKTQESGRETLEELARQVIGSREEFEASCRNEYEQMWSSGEVEKRFKRFNLGYPEEESKEKLLKDWIKIELSEYDYFKKYVENIANPSVFAKLTEQDRRNLLKFTLLRKEQTLSDRALFAQQKLRYYLNFRKNHLLHNVAQEDPLTFGKTGLPTSFYGPFSPDSEKLYSLGKRSYEKLCDRMRTEVPRIYKHAREVVEEWAKNNRILYLHSYGVGVEELSKSDKGNFGVFNFLMASANSFVKNRLMTEPEWNALNSIKDEAIEINKFNRRRYH